MTTPLILIFVYLIVLKTTLYFQAYENVNDDFLSCPHNTTQCFCRPNPEIHQLVIDCQYGNTAAYITEELTDKGEKSVALDCNDALDTLVVSNIPAFNMNDISILQIQRCRSSTPKTALVPVFRHFNIMRDKLTHLHLIGNGLIDLPEDVLSHLPSLKYLDFRSNRLQQIERRQFHKLTNLTLLDLGENGISTIEAGAFSALRQLRLLNLWGNSLTTVHSNWFEGANTVEMLDLSVNGISILKNDVFFRLPALKVINLSGNGLTELPENLLQYNSALEHFKLINNRKETGIKLFSKLFANQTNLKIVELTCMLQQLPEDLFVHNSNLKNLSLTRNDLTRLPPTIFYNQTQLLHLDLSYNKLTQIEKDWFVNMRTLETLNLGHNQIKKITDFAFDTLHQLIEIRLNDNLLENINKELFEFTLAIKKIDLSGNFLPNIISHFYKLPALEELALDNNNLTKIYYSDLIQFRNSKPMTINLSMSNIEAIDFPIIKNDINLPQSNVTVNLEFNPVICNCNLYNFWCFLNSTSTLKQRQTLKFIVSELQCSGPKEVINLKVTHLKADEFVCRASLKMNSTSVYDFSNNNLVEVPTLSTKKDEKFILRINNNMISELPYDFKKRLGFGSVTEIYAQHNQISNVNRISLNYLSSLTVLDLSNNLLTSFENDTFKGLMSLRVLKLSHNKFSKIINVTFDWIYKLIELYLDNNHINTINVSPTSSFLAKLEKLNLSHNKLTTIGKPFHDLFNLKVLDLSHNKIKNFESNDIPQIVDLFLNLSYNQVNKIDFTTLEQSIEFFSATKVVLYMEHNRFDCDCNIYDFVRYLQHDMSIAVEEKFAITIENLKCAYPEKLKNRVVTTLKLDEVTCENNEMAIMKSIGIENMIENSRCPNTSLADVCPQNQVCCCSYHPHNQTLSVKCSNTGLNEFPELISNTWKNKRIEKFDLHMDHNNITSLPTVGKAFYNQVANIFAQHNRISKITANQIRLLPNLITLNLANNALSTIDNATLEQMRNSTKLFHILLSQNPWACSCELTGLVNFITTTSKIFSNISEMQCAGNGKTFPSLSEAVLCDVISNTTRNSIFIWLVVVLLVVLLVLSTCCLLYVKYQHEIKIWLYAHNIHLGCNSEEAIDRNKEYDAFISYSHEDENFVLDLINVLESKENRCRTCIHERDWIPGQEIMEQIIRSVENSRRTIVILSSNFLQSMWGQMEFRTAHQKAISEKRARVIIILLGDIGDLSTLDEELKAYLNANTYVKWNDKWFWEKLGYALRRPLKQPPISVFQTLLNGDDEYYKLLGWKSSNRIKCYFPFRICRND